MTKVCYTCKTEKSLDSYTKNKANKDGYRGICRSCFNKYKRSMNNPPMTDGTKVCTKCKLEKSISRFKIDKRSSSGRGSMCKDCMSIANKKRRSSLNNKPATDGTKTCNKCKLEKQVFKFSRNKDNSDGLQSWCKQCRNSQSKEYNSRPEIIKRHSSYQTDRRKNNIQHYLRCILRHRLYEAIKGNQKTGSAVRDLGCSIKFLKSRLESMFYPHLVTGKKMTWDNHGVNGWHLDHKISLSSFDLSDREQFLKAVHYTNLQPLWKEENLKKGASL